MIPVPPSLVTRAPPPPYSAAYFQAPTLAVDDPFKGLLDLPPFTLGCLGGGRRITRGVQESLTRAHAGLFPTTQDLPAYVATITTLLTGSSLGSTVSVSVV